MSANEEVEQSQDAKMDLVTDAEVLDRVKEPEKVLDDNADHTTATASGTSQQPDNNKKIEEQPLFSDPTENASPNEADDGSVGQVVRWSETLPSPTLPAFSPSIDPNKSEKGYHGTGLSLSFNRTRQLNRTTNRCVVVLQELTSIYAQFAISLNKAGQLLPSTTSALTAAAEAGGQESQLPLLPLQESMSSWARDKNKVAKQVRAAISPLSQTYLATHNDTINGIQQRYNQSRSTCAYARRRALIVRTKYLKSMLEAENLIKELKGNTVDENGSTSKPDNATDRATIDAPKGTPSRGPKRLEAKIKETLKEVRQYEAKYKLRVRWENDCVALCQRLEKMALDTMQKMEEDRLAIFVDAMAKVMEAQKQALDSGVISLTRKTEQEEQNGEPAEAGKKRAHNFVKMLTGATNSSFLLEEEPSGTMDAETLGLPEEIGLLRDRVRERLDARRERIQLAKALSLFFENVVKASAKLGQSLLQLLKKENSNYNESLHVAMGACEGAHVLRLWDGMTSFFEAEAEGCFAMADSLRNIRAAKLDSVILYGEKAMKSTAENGDLAWKQLCESARAQAKAEAKYRQSSLESAKARERLLSLDSKSQHQPQEDKDGKDRMVVAKRMQKGLSNIVSLLPDGGDKAMKILGPGARASHAQRGLKEADEKEAKEKDQLVAVVEATAAALKVYKAESEHVVARYDVEEKEGWDDITSSIESFADFAQKLLGTLQLESISDIQPIASQSQLGIVTDMNDWRMRAQQELVAICVDCTEADDSAESGFRLEVRNPPSSATVEAYLETTGAVIENETKEIVNDDASLDEDLEDDDTEESAVADAIEGSQSTSSEQNKQSDDVTVKALFRRSVLSSQVVVGNNRRPIVKKHKSRGRTGSDHEDPETDLFLTYFWPDPVDARGVPMVVDSFPCSFRDGGHQLPFQYGRVYVSSTRLIFVSWTKKKLNLRWEEIREINENKKSFDGRNDTAIQILCKRMEAAEESCMILDGFYERQNAVDVMAKLQEEARAAAATLSSPSSEVIQDTTGGLVRPDDTLQKMKIVVSKRLKKISIQRFHQIVWSEKEKPLYQPWLEKEAFDVEMGDWKTGSCEGPWCNESYNEQRLIKFRIKRKTHLYIGPPIANVVQTHRCRLDGNDVCVVSMTIEFEGIPYSDTFAVEVRWVALREGTDDIKLECGLVVDFRKKTFLRSKIQSGTIEESTPVHKSFFATLQAACVEAGGMEVGEAEEPEVNEQEKAEAANAPGLSKSVQAIKENPYLIHIAAVAGPILLYIVWRFFVMPRSVVAPHAEPQLVDILIQRLASLEAKVDALQSSMDELLEASRQPASNHSI